MNNKVSIIIPTFNGEKYIKETIDSCINQTYNNIEIIIVEDCSSDTTVEILKQYGEKIQIHQNEQNQGISRNVNKGVSLSTGDFFILLGHDDVLGEKHIEIMLREFDKDTVFVHCNAYLIDKNSKTYAIGVNDKKQIIKTMMIKYFLIFGPVVHSTGTIIKKGMFIKAKGWDEKYKNYGEWLVWIKLSSLGKVKYCTKIKAFYRRHDTNITNTFTDEKVKPELSQYNKSCESTALFNISNIIVKNLIIFILYIKR